VQHSMFYALLILPHIMAIAGLMWFAFRAGDDGRHDGGDGLDWLRTDDDDPITPAPRPGPAAGPPLPDADQPRRLQVGEQLSERVVRRPRREPLEPDRAPQKPREPERTSSER
jgi:hypothetical protein